jgi:hypothetical protein
MPTYGCYIGVGNKILLKLDRPLARITAILVR